MDNMKVQDFMDSMNYERDERVLKGLIEELKSKGEEMISNMKDLSISNDERHRIQLYKRDEMEGVVKSINTRPFLVYHNGEISRVNVFSTNLPVKAKGKQAFSEEQKLILNIYGIGFVKVLGLDNNYSQETLNRHMLKNRIGEVKNIIIGAGIFPLEDYQGGTSATIGAVNHPLVRTRFGSSCTHGANYELKDDVNCWVSYRGDTEKEDDIYNRGSYNSEVPDWNVPIGEGYLLKPNDNLVESVRNAEIGDLMMDYKGQPMIHNTIDYSEIENMEIFKHKFDRILNTRENIGVRLNALTGMDLGYGIARGEYVISTKKDLILNIVRKELEEKIVDENIRETVVEILKDSIIHFTPSQGHRMESFFYNDESGRFEVDSHYGTYKKGVAIEELLGEKKPLEISRTRIIKVGNIEGVDSVENRLINKGNYVKDSDVKRQIRPLNTLYVYARSNLTDGIPLAIAPFKKGNGVVNRGDRLGYIENGLSRMKYVIYKGEPSAISAPRDVEGNVFMISVLDVNDESMKNKVVDKGEEIFPLKQGLFSMVNVNNKDKERYLDESNLDKGLDYYKIGGQVVKPTKVYDSYSFMNKRDKEYNQVVKHAPLNATGISHLSALMENGGLVFKVFQDIDITENENVTRYE